MRHEQIVKQIEIYLKREKAQLDSLEDAIKTTSNDYQAAKEDNAKSRLLRYLKVDVEAACQSKLKIQEAELYLLLGKVLEIRDQHVAQAANREDLVARRIARLVSGSTGDNTNSRMPAAHKKPDDLSNVLTLPECMYRLARRVILTERAKTKGFARLWDERQSKIMLSDGTSDRRIYAISRLRFHYGT